jgi:HD-GYP domain-containing protein (c-di-GMP phosphodiesterase class II)
VNVLTDTSVHLQDFIRHITTAISNSLLYSLDHQQVSRLCKAAQDSVLAAMEDAQDLQILVIHDEIVAGERPLDNSMYVNRFSQIMRNRGIGHLRILKAVTVQEIRSLVGTLGRHGTFQDDARSTDNIRLGRVEIRNTLDNNNETAGRIMSLADVPVEELATFMELYEDARNNKKLNIVGISEIVTSFIDSFKQVADPLLALAPLRALDEYTFTHSTNVCILNLAQAMSLGIDGPLLNDIGIAAMLHDIGKLYIPEEILNKPGQLDDAEWEIMKLHPVRGAQRLMDTPGVPRIAIVTAYEHHLKYNMSGYPRVAENWQQNICSHMTTISDLFDALRTKRSYKGSVELDEISAIMMEISGTDIHPVLARNFITIISRLSNQSGSNAAASSGKGTLTVQ